MNLLETKATQLVVESQAHKVNVKFAKLYFAVVTLHVKEIITTCLEIFDKFLYYFQGEKRSSIMLVHYRIGV